MKSIKKGFDMATDCMVCGKRIGHRGFCSQKCHDKYYDNLPIEDKKTPYEKIYELAWKEIPPIGHVNDIWTHIDKAINIAIKQTHKQSQKDKIRKRQRPQNRLTAKSRNGSNNL